jgi:hypothetical protein
MTGLEIIGIIFVVGALSSAIANVDTDSRTEICLMCIETETHSEVDTEVQPNES